MEEYAQMHTFKYNAGAFGPRLEVFSVSEFNQGIEAMLQANHYTLIEESGAIRVYSSELRVEPYLLILHADRYDFIFYIPDESSVMTWKKEYGLMPVSLWLKTFLPAQPKPIEGPTFTMNLKKAFLSH